MATRDADEMVIRPMSLKGAGTAGVVAASGWVIASLAFLLRFHGLALVIVGVVDLVAFGVGVYFAVVLRPRYTLRLRDRELLFTSAVHKERIVLSRGEGARVVQLDATGIRAAGAPSRMWLLVRHDNTVALKLNRAAWDEDELESLRERLGPSLEAIHEPQPIAAVRDTYPGIASWWVAHPGTVALAVVMGTIAAGVVIAALPRH